MTDCASLRTKGMLLPDNPKADRLTGGSPTAVYWCRRTQTVTGPDGRRVAPGECGVSRSCFEPAGRGRSGLRDDPGH